MATAQEVLDRTRSTYRTGATTNPSLRTIRKKVAEKKATHHDLYEYARQSGRTLSKSLKANLTEDLLINEVLPPDIVAEVLANMSAETWDDVTALGVDIQTAINESQGIGLKGIEPIKNNRADGIVKRIVEAPKFEDIEWILEAPIETMITKIADDMIYANADYMARSGFKTVISRVTNGGCCEWCEGLSGAFEYGKHPDDIFRRHQRCTCTVEFQTDGKLTDAWTKKQYAHNERKKNVENSLDYLKRLDDANEEWRKQSKRIAKGDKGAKTYAQIQKEFGL